MSAELEGLDGVGGGQRQGGAGAPQVSAELEAWMGWGGGRGGVGAGAPHVC